MPCHIVPVPAVARFFKTDKGKISEEEISPPSRIILPRRQVKPDGAKTKF
jgi:hypothetical protein